MDQIADNEKKPPHLRIAKPSPWVERFAPLAKPGGTFLDVTCGGGRHSRLFLELGFTVVGIDRDLEYVQDIKAKDDVELIQADLEDGSPWPMAGRTFSGVAMIYYVNRTLLPKLIDALEPGGILICESLAEGDETYHWPKKTDHLLRNGELLELVQGRLQVVAYEHGLLEHPFPNRPFPGIVQRICAVNDLKGEAGGRPRAPAHDLLPAPQPALKA